MTESPTLDCLEGTGEARAAFPDLDQHFFLKPRAYVDVCMLPAFKHLARVADLFAMRREGVYPIMFYMTIEPSDVPLVFGSPLSVDYEVRLRRYRPNPSATAEEGAPASDRFLLDNRFNVSGKRGSGKAEEMDAGRADAPLEPVGRARIVQVLTRPLAPPGQRQVTELPKGFRVLREHPWDEPYPTWQRLGGVPEGFAETSLEPQPHESVWGVANSDINQHITLTEYIGKMEDHLSRMLHAGGLPLRRHRVRRVETLFMKPFFAGEPYRVTGRLWCAGQETLMLGGIQHQSAQDGTWPPLDSRPAVFIRLEGFVDRGEG